jgi:hypothetical protein
MRGFSVYFVRDFGLRYQGMLVLLPPATWVRLRELPDLF